MGWKAYVHMAFKKLIQPNIPTKIKIDNTKKKPYIIVIGVVIIWRILKRTVLKK
jgi:hypothetical protein